MISITGRWKRWFAWHPVKVNGAWVWWISVERRMISYILMSSIEPTIYNFEYRWYQSELGEVKGKTSVKT